MILNIYNVERKPFFMKQQAPRTQSDVARTSNFSVKELLTGMCVRYTVFCMVILLISSLMGGSTKDTVVVTARFFLLLPLSLCLTLAALVRRSHLGTPIKAILHPMLSLGGLYLCGYLPYQVSAKPTGEQVLAILLLALIIYAITAVIYLMVTRKKRQRMIDDTPYEGVFTSQNKH
jgi:hypothetical protein